MNSFERISAFLEEYATLFEGILVTEKDKLQILMHGTVKEIEKTIAIQQMNEKKIQNIEKKRAEIQAELGFAHLTFKQIIEQFESHEQQKLNVLFDRIDSTLKDIKFFNKKGMDIAQTNLYLFGENQQTNTLYSKESIIKK